MIPETMAQRIKDAHYERLQELLRDCAEAIEPYVDVVDGDDGRPEANWAMSLLARIEAELAE